jgi:hypothetical protein
VLVEPVREVSRVPVVPVPLVPVPVVEPDVPVVDPDMLPDALPDMVPVFPPVVAVPPVAPAVPPVVPAPPVIDAVSVPTAPPAVPLVVPSLLLPLLHAAMSSAVLPTTTSRAIRSFFMLFSSGNGVVIVGAAQEVYTRVSRTRGRALGAAQAVFPCDIHYLRCVWTRTKCAPPAG